MDVHADTIAVAVAEPDEEVPPLGIIPNRLESVRKLVAKLGPARQLMAEEFTSENAEMLATVDLILRQTQGRGIWTIDRDADRKKFLEPCWSAVNASSSAPPANAR